MKLPILPDECEVICIGRGFSNFVSPDRAPNGSSVSIARVSSVYVAASRPDTLFVPPASSHLPITSVVRFLRTTQLPVAYWGRASEYRDEYELMATVYHFGKGIARYGLYETFADINLCPPIYYHPASGQKCEPDQLRPTLKEIMRDGKIHLRQLRADRWEDSAYNLWRPFVSLMLAYENAVPNKNVFLQHDFFTNGQTRIDIVARLEAALSLV